MKFWNWSGAKMYRHYRSWKMLQHGMFPLVAKIGSNTAENERRRLKFGKCCQILPAAHASVTSLRGEQVKRGESAAACRSSAELLRGPCGVQNASGRTGAQPFRIHWQNNYIQKQNQNWSNQISRPDPNACTDNAGGIAQSNQRLIETWKIEVYWARNDDLIGWVIVHHARHLSSVLHAEIHLLVPTRNLA